MRFYFVILDIPVCSSSVKKVFGTGLKEGIDIPCSVDSYPHPISFRWAYNYSDEVVYLPQNSHSFTENISSMRYVPHTEHDYGTLLCWAANEVGAMKEPCVIHIVPAGKHYMDAYIYERLRSINY